MLKGFTQHFFTAYRSSKTTFMNAIFTRCKKTSTSVTGTRPTPFTDFIQDVDEKQFLVNFANVSELQTAPEKVKKLFTLEYGTAQDKKEKKIFDLINEIDNKNRCRAHVSEIVNITFSIKEKQEIYLNKRKGNGHIVNEIINLAQSRVELLDKLRDRHFEAYTKALTLLNLNHFFKPQYDVKATHLADEVVDMRVRAFAQSRKLTAVSNKRLQKLAMLQEKYQHELSTSDNTLES